MFCLILRRLSYPVRLASLCDEFGRSRSWCSSVFTDAILYLYRRWQAPLHWNEAFFSRERIQAYGEAIERRGGGDCYWGYIDGTIVQISRPDEHQRIWYSGYKHLHCFKYQCIVTPDGLIASAAGPYVGKRADAWMVRDSGLSDNLRKVFSLPLEPFTWASSFFRFSMMFHTKTATISSATRLMEAHSASWVNIRGGAGIYQVKSTRYTIAPWLASESRSNTHLQRYPTIGSQLH